MMMQRYLALYFKVILHGKVDVVDAISDYRAKEVILSEDTMEAYLE